MLEEARDKAPKGCSELGWITSELGSISQALKHYSAHRKTGDPQRSPSHQNLYRTFNDVVRRSVEQLQRQSKQKSVKLPCVEQDLETLFRKTIDAGPWTYICNTCGWEDSDRSKMWFGKTEVFCPSCTKRYTHKCCHCETRVRREDTKQSNLVRDNENRDTMTVCPACMGKGEIKANVCGGCGCKYTGSPAGNDNEGVTSDEVTAVVGQGVCFACGDTYQRGDCGHVTNRSYEVIDVPNVEDDDRDREDIGRGFSRVCGKCRDKFVNDDEPVQHWAAAKSKCTSRTYSEVGSRRSFGVEIEVVQPQKMRPMPDEMKAYWTSKRDASLPEIGVELASTVLYGDTGLGVVKDLCDYAKKYDWRVDARAGLHLHIGLPDEKDGKLSAVAMGYHMTYDMWSSFVAPSRQRCKYCRKNSCDARKLSTQSPTDLLHSILTDPAIEGRRCWVNWHSFNLHNTVEIRLHHGTLMYEKIANWVKAHTRFVDWCVSKGSHEEVYKLLAGKTVRQQFLLITQAAWKDRALGRYFRKRARELFDGCAPLPDTNRQLIKRGIKPDQYKPGFNFTIGDRAAYICRLGERHYVISDHPTGNRHSYCMSMNGWSTEGPAYKFATRADGIGFIKLTREVGLEKALSSLKSKPKKARTEVRGLEVRLPREFTFTATAGPRRTVTRTT